MKNILQFCFLFVSGYLCSQNIYFPPINSNSWETRSPLSLGWCESKIDPLYNFLEQENTKAFIVLKDGKIVLEKYFSTFKQDSFWYWASAGKTITSFLIGQAQEENLLSIEDASSKYLGTNWTHETPLQESKITIRNQLTMTSGLDDGVADNHCTLPACLTYLADPYKRWAYHNAPYTLLEKVIEKATQQNINAYTTQQLGNRTGMTGFWYTLNYDNVFFSKARSMARFGILIQNNGIWQKDTLLKNNAYKFDMIHSSQNINLSYGYLWWLNGQASYMLPGIQFKFSGSLAPNAPKDMYAAMGKNGQFLCISPSLGLVVVRMGDAPSSSSSEVPNIFCNQIWQKLNEVICNPTSLQDIESINEGINIFPNPSDQFLQIQCSEPIEHIELFDLSGKQIYSETMNSEKNKLNIENFAAGSYYIKCKLQSKGFHIKKFIITR